MPWPRSTAIVVTAVLVHGSAAGTAGAAPTHDEVVGRVTGLAIPRFVSLRSDKVNLRVGPGRRYPIAWVLQRRSLPVQITEEFKDWRSVCLHDGTCGWVHRVMLSGQRSFIVVQGPTRTLLAAAAEHARPVARLRPHVVGRIVSCPALSAWCLVQVRGYQGYLRRAAFWGTSADEAVSE